MTKEIEIKLKIESGKLDRIIQKLSQLGGKRGELYNQTTYGFFKTGSIEEGIFPRIRDEKGKVVLTVKVRPKKKSKFFERKEYSMEISNAKEGVGIMALLGWDEVRIFKKNRTEWKFPKVKVVVDSLYFGKFVEIEGQKDDIRKLAEKLGYKENEWIAKAYLALEDEYKQQSQV